STPLSRPRRARENCRSRRSNVMRSLISGSSPQCRSLVSRGIIPIGDTTVRCGERWVGKPLLLRYYDDNQRGGSNMVITLGPDLVIVLKAQAEKQGVEPEVLAVNALRERFLATRLPFQPRDEWERRLLDAATDCGMSFSNEAVSSDGLYE